ncbi:hypothetical protein [Bacteroides sp.]|uniref:hypothetical protein n=1 Tax=Bacteroides sp. TaxID=29523 RepID=UPI002A82965C|nr:hypothetical protein [Bacteroides sp.]
MRKWTYLVAALLVGGATTTFTGCIDNDEPASITELRGAKAELIKAKAAVQTAEAAYKEAQIAIVNAKAAYLEEKVAQEKLKTEVQAAKTEAMKAYWQQKAEKSAELFKAKMLELQIQTAQAQAAYEKAMIDIEVALLGYKDNAYATKLNELLYTQSFAYTPKEITYDEESGKISVEDGEETTVKGLIELSGTLSDAQEELADLMRQKSLLEFSYDPEALIAGVTNQIAIQKGEVKGIEENLAQLKVVAEIPLDQFEAKYKELNDKKTDLDNKINAIDLSKVSDADYQAAVQQVAEVQKAKEAKGEFTFDIPATIQDGFARMILEKQTLDNNDLANSFRPAIKIDPATGKYYFPDGFRFSKTMQEKRNMLEAITTLLTDKVKTSEEQAQAKLAQAQAKVDYDAFQAELTKVEGTWTKASEAFYKAVDAGKYLSQEGHDARSLIIADYQTYQKDYESAAGDAAKEKAALDKFIAQYKTYLTARTTLDGLKLKEETDITKDAAKLDAWKALITENNGTTSYDAVFGVEDLFKAEGGLAADFVKAAKAAGYSNERQTTAVYAEWLAAYNKALAEHTGEGEFTFDPDGIALTQNGLADKTFGAKKEYDALTDEINNVSVWADLNSKLMAMGTDNDKAIAATDTKLATAQITLNQITEKYDAEKASLEVQKAGLNCILGTMKKALPQTGDNNQPLSTYEDAIKYLKNEIAKIEGAPSEVDDESGNITVKSGTLAKAKAELNMYDALLKALQDGSYEQEQATAIKLKEAQIDAKTFEIEALTVLFNKAKEMKDQLIKTLTGDTSAE